jgi:hypothetical protein
VQKCLSDCDAFVQKVHLDLKGIRDKGREKIERSFFMLKKDINSTLSLTQNETLDIDQKP